MDQIRNTNAPVLFMPTLLANSCDKGGFNLDEVGSTDAGRELQQSRNPMEGGSLNDTMLHRSASNGTHSQAEIPVAVRIEDTHKTKAEEQPVGDYKGSTINDFSEQEFQRKQVVIDKSIGYQEKKIPEQKALDGLHAAANKSILEPVCIQV